MPSNCIGWRTKELWLSRKTGRKNQKPNKRRKRNSKNLWMKLLRIRSYERG